jgi:hypothetical protein
LTPEQVTPLQVHGSTLGVDPEHAHLLPVTSRLPLLENAADKAHMAEPCVVALVKVRRKKSRNRMTSKTSLLLLLLLLNIDIDAFTLQVRELFFLYRVPISDTEHQCLTLTLFFNKGILEPI